MQALWGDPGYCLSHIFKPYGRYDEVLDEDASAL